MPGRVGDTPVIGAGTWACDRTCAVSGVGGLIAVGTGGPPVLPSNSPGMLRGWQVEGGPPHTALV